MKKSRYTEEQIIATMRDFALASTRKNERTSPKLGVLLEAARRATWDALQVHPT